MNLKKLFSGVLAAVLALPAIAEEPVIINGSIINWYYYGKDIHSSDIGWHQTPVGNGSDGSQSNYGLMSLYNADGTVGIYDFPIRNHILYSNASGVFVGDAYYSFYMGEDGWEDNMDSEYGSENYTVKVRKWTWDEGVDSDGKKTYTNVKYQQLKTIKVQPIDLTYDPLNDVVYGIFYNGSSYKFGTIDMETFEVNYISKEGIIYGAPKCIAINSKGVLYAIDASGYVYSVNKEDGQLTTIGHVGFKSQDRMMSATFDLRDDKLYWIGFVNDGKLSNATDGTNNTLPVKDGGRDTGLFEVSTETGVATKIADLYKSPSATVDANGNIIWEGWRGLQLTGIYVDGCFTKKNIDQRIVLTSCPSQLKVGETGIVKVNVKNIGLQKVLAKNYKVNFYADGTLLGSLDRDDDNSPVDNLEAGQSQNLEFRFTAPARGGKLSLYAEVVNEGDEELRNNKTEVATIIILNGKTLPTVTLQGTYTSNGHVSLEWQDPQGHVTEGAENFAAFSYENMNDWTMVDGDKAYTQSPNSWNDAISYPNSSTPKAFIVFNPEEAGINLTGSVKQFRPFNGKQFFAAFYSAVPDDSEEGGHQVANDDYMISPTLNGDAQTISFYAKGYKGSVAEGYETEANYPETMEVLYTTEDNLDPTTYEVAKKEFTVENTAWTRYEAQLPAGAKHFALHCTSAEGFVLMIDDITFTIAPMTVISYNVYKNGVLETTLSADNTSYNAGKVAKSDEFTVTAIYDDGESATSNPWSINIATSIAPVVVSQTSGQIRTYDLNGRPVSGKPTPGIYIVRQADGQTRKVVIR